MPRPLAIAAVYACAVGVLALVSVVTAHAVRRSIAKSARSGVRWAVGKEWRL
jgi:hypothetical protein